jgi:hypothetical protein
VLKKFAWLGGLRPHDVIARATRPKLNFLERLCQDNRRVDRITDDLLRLARIRHHLLESVEVERARNDMFADDEGGRAMDA